MSDLFKENQGPPKFTALYDAETDRALSQTRRGMAHMVDLKRTDNARCRTCGHFVQAKTRKANGELREGQCRKWWEDSDPKIRGKTWPKIPYAQMACKYHEPASNPPPSHVRMSAYG